MKSARCTYRDAANRRCRLTTDGPSSLCFRHAAQAEADDNAALISSELASLSGEYKTASEINRVLGKLFDLLAQNRIDRARANTLAYIAQLLLFTLPTVRKEMHAVHGVDAWHRAVLRAFTLNGPQGREGLAPNRPPAREGSPSPVAGSHAAPGFSPASSVSAVQEHVG